MNDSVQVLHSSVVDGRHWLTSMTIPPVQLLPVAPNHCRIGAALLRAIAERIEESEDVPDSLDLRGVVVDLVMKPGPQEDQDHEDDDSIFVTPQPPKNWAGSYDEWIASVAGRLGFEPPELDSDGTAYERALSDAARRLSTLLPALRERFLAGFGGLNLGFKFGLPTRKGGKEFVWLQPTEWSNPDSVRGILQSQPYDCKGFKLGQVIDVPVQDLADYAVGSESQGLVESGPTQRVAEDYGLILP